MTKNLFASESVCSGHPDKVSDQISDAVLDAALEQDKNSRVACETLVTTGTIVIAGEITTRADIDFSNIARGVVKSIGYDDSSMGFDHKCCAVIPLIGKQSADIAMGVDRDGAGDQGMMFGYAVNETHELMPLPIMLAHKLAQKMEMWRKSGVKGYLRPDGKSQVVVEYRENRPIRVVNVLISTQHDESVLQEEIREDMITLAKIVIPEKYLDAETVFNVNPTGRFVIGGPHGDCGLTGRKIIVDTYGGRGRHGGGACSGKDPSKVDRSAAYAARHAAKCVVDAGLAAECEVQLSYAIGLEHPLSVFVNTFNTSHHSDETIEKWIKEKFDFRPRAIIERLNLKNIQYRPTAAYGHFGRTGENSFTWEDMHDNPLKK